jgi:hypothetical protein
VRSIKNELAVPTSTDSNVTQLATTTLVQMLPSMAVSANSPRRVASAPPKNQSSVKPRQGRAGVRGGQRFCRTSLSKLAP